MTDIQPLVKILVEQVQMDREICLCVLLELLTREIDLGGTFSDSSGAVDAKHQIAARINEMERH